MEKSLLATISNDADHLFGVRFICSFFKDLSEYQVTLLHICRLDNNASKTSASTIWQDPGRSIKGQFPAGAKVAINKARELLRSNRVPVDQVITKTIAECYGKVKDILTESSKGFYDAIVLGRRASYTFQWMFERSADETFQSMIKDSSCVSPLWICSDIEPKRKNVLLCIDGSESCYRAVDHVGYILSTQQQHSITLFHVENTVGTECVEFFFRAEKILKQHSIAAKQIRSKVTWGASVSGTIESEAKSGGYAVIAIGMGGQKRSDVSKLWLTGKTAAKLISKTQNLSLWCCP